jgi:hypothetical protein
MEDRRKALFIIAVISVIVIASFLIYDFIQLFTA